MLYEKYITGTPNMILQISFLKTRLIFLTSVPASQLNKKYYIQNSFDKKHIRHTIMKEVHKCHNLWKWFMKLCHCPRHLRFSRSKEFGSETPKINSGSKAQCFCKSRAFFSFRRGPVFWILDLFSLFWNFKGTSYFPLFITAKHLSSHSFTHVLMKQTPDGELKY